MNNNISDINRMSTTNGNNVVQVKLFIEKRESGMRLHYVLINRGDS